MASTQARTLDLPVISEVDATDTKLGSFMSDLDSFASSAARFVGSEHSLEDEVFASRTGIALERHERHADPAMIARLLVFADDVLDAAEHIREEAGRLRRDLLTAYREYVIDRAAGIGDDA